MGNQLRIEGVRGLVLDWNGTLKSMHQLLEQDLYVAATVFGKYHTREYVAGLFGSSPEDFFTKLYGIQVGEGKEMSLAEARIILRRHDDDFPKRLMPGVATTLLRLRNGGLRLGIATADERQYVIKEAAQAGLPTGFFEFIHTREDLLPGKPALTKAVDHFTGMGYDIDQIGMVGDEGNNLRDALAVNIGKCAIVASGTKSRTQLVQDGVPEKIIVATFSDVPGVFGID